MSALSDQRKRMRELARQGFEVSLTNGSHYRVVAPNGEVTHTASSPSDRRGHLNFMAWVKRQQRHHSS